MKEKHLQAFLFLTDSYKLSYLRLFLESNKNIYSLLNIVIVGTSITQYEALDCNKKVRYIYIPNPNGFDSNSNSLETETFGNRVIDLLISESCISNSVDQAFFLHGTKLNYIMNALKQRVTGPIFLFLDEFKWTRLLQTNKFLIEKESELGVASNRVLKQIHDKECAAAIELSDLVLVSTYKDKNLLSVLYSLYSDRYIYWPYGKHQLFKIKNGDALDTVNSDKQRIILMHSEGFTKSDYKTIFSKFKYEDKVKIIIVGEVSTSLLPDRIEIRNKLLFIDSENYNNLRFLTLPDLIMIKNLFNIEKYIVANYLSHKIPMIVFNTYFGKLPSSGEIKKILFSDLAERRKYVDDKNYFYHILGYNDLSDDSISHMPSYKKLSSRLTSMISIALTLRGNRVPE